MLYNLALRRNLSVTDSPERQSLRTLTLTVVKSLASLNKLLQIEASPQRDKKIQRVLTELEVHNDAAMREGLNATAQYIVGVKMGRVKIAKQDLAPRTQSEPKNTDHQDLMKFHHDHIKGPIGDAAAQGAAIKWLLQHYSAEALKQCYTSQTKDTWRSGRVSWLTVRRDIGGWLNQNTPTPQRVVKTETPEQKVKREGCTRCWGTGNEVIPGKGAITCDHEPRTTNASSSKLGNSEENRQARIS